MHIVFTCLINGRHWLSRFYWNWEKYTLRISNYYYYYYIFFKKLSTGYLIIFVASWDFQLPYEAYSRIWAENSVSINASYHFLLVIFQLVFDFSLLACVLWKCTGEDCIEPILFGVVFYSTNTSLSLSLSLSRERASLHAHTLLVTIFNSHNCFLLKTFGLIGNQKKKSFIH